MEGYGSYFNIDGNIYTGEWRANRKHGKGIFKDKNGNVVQEGFWKNNVF